MSLEKDVIIIESILKKLLDRYSLYTLEEEKKIHMEIFQFVKKYELALREDFRGKKRRKKNMTSSKENIKKVLEGLGVNDYQKKFYEYIIVKLLPKQIKSNVFLQEDFFDYFLKPFAEVKSEILANRKRALFRYNSEEEAEHLASLNASPVTGSGQKGGGDGNP